MAMMPSEANDSRSTTSATDRAVSSATHGFLFADLRGYTAYLDRRGAMSGAALLQRFRDLVRVAVSAHNGAEIRTEGDSFYVVFPSASTAVTCALEIVRAAGDEIVGEEDRIQVGVGVHAGEAVETPEGPVGMSVNIAARLCAMARPGEVVVSDTVRSLTRSVGSAAFVPLGRRAVKGTPRTAHRLSCSARGGGDRPRAASGPAVLTARSCSARARGCRSCPGSTRPASAPDSRSHASGLHARRITPCVLDHQHVGHMPGPR
jgi:class 3 adenylate cyclase